MLFREITYALLAEIQRIVADKGRFARTSWSREDRQLSSPMAFQQCVQHRISLPLKFKTKILPTMTSQQCVQHWISLPLRFKTIILPTIMSEQCDKQSTRTVKMFLTYDLFKYCAQNCLTLAF